MLVGRESERQVISALLAGARVGDSRVLVLSGEPGIGKTALLDEAAGLTGNMAVLRARGIESERLVPFAGLLQLLRPLLPLLDTIPAPQAAALSSALMLDSGGGTHQSRFAVGAATLSLLSRAAEDRPTAVLVDDGHLLDSPSAEAVVFAARRLLSDPVAVLVALRPGDAGAAVWSSLPTRAVSGLDLDAARELVTQRTSRPVRREHLDRLFRATAGNPLALLELGDHADPLELLPAGSPVRVSEELSRSFLGRAADLSAAARTALAVAATDSTELVTVLRTCSTLGLPTALLEDAAEAGLLRTSEGRIEFRHPLVRSAVYQATDPDTRRAIHRAFAKVVPADQTDRLAWHLSEGSVAPDEATAGILDVVAEQAALRGAHAIAETAHERAAELTVPFSPQLAHRLCRAGEAAWLAGLPQHAMALLDRAAACRPDPLLDAHIRELQGAVLTRCGSLKEALTTLTGAAQAVETTDVDTAVRLLADAVHVCVYLASPTDAMRACAAIDRLLPSCRDPDARFLGSMAEGMAQVLSGLGASGLEKVRRTAYPLVFPDDVPADHFRLPLRIQGALWLRDSGPLRDDLGGAIDHMREKAALGSLPYLLWQTARDAATTDRWDDAAAAYHEAIRLSRETGQSTDLAVSMAGLAWLEARRGRAQECHQHVAAADDLCRQNEVRLGRFWLEFAQGDLAAALGATEAAVDHYEVLERRLRAVGLADPDQSAAPELVESLMHLGRVEDARRAAESFAEKAEAKGHPWSLARAHRARALCASGATAEEWFRSARELHGSTPDRYEAARTDLAFGACLRRAHRRVEARGPLQRALERFESLGAAPWADRAAHELEATGATAHRREASAVDELTPQEWQIAQLLARGRTTREAAAALFLSPKTVEYHLRHVYLKLGIRSRGELAERFGG